MVPEGYLHQKKWELKLKRITSIFNHCATSVSLSVVFVLQVFTH